MKLFIIATLIAVSYAARLEHLEQQQQQLRAYLPPSQAAGFGPSAHGSFGPNGAFGAAGAGQPDLNAIGAFPSTSNQYLPPDHGPAAFPSAGTPDFAGSINGFEAQNVPSQQYGQQGSAQFGQAVPNQFGHQDATPLGSSPLGSHTGFQPQPAVISQYPQQPFDEQTGYHY